MKKKVKPKKEDEIKIPKPEIDETPIEESSPPCDDLNPWDGAYGQADVGPVG
jgi:hypothetical protein